MKKSGNVYSINISKKKGGKKSPVRDALINEMGIEGDGHSGDWHRQISFLAYESITDFNSKGKIQTKPGDFGENITTEGINVKDLEIGNRLSIGDKGDNVILEVTQIGKECPKPCSIYYQVGDCIMPKNGIFFKVIETGKISVGNKIEIIKDN
jgi:MOSC domain-containing protein YiiM